MGRMAQIRHLLDFEVAEKAIEVAIVTTAFLQLKFRLMKTVDCLGLTPQTRKTKPFYLKIYQDHWLLQLMIQLAMFCGCLILTMCRLIVFND